MGKQGSGKSTIGKRLARLLRTEQIETSDVVREIVGDKERSELPATGEKTKDDPTWLSTALSEKIKKASLDQVSGVVVVTGIREIEVHSQLQKLGAHIWPFELKADPAVRFLRLYLMGKVRDAHDFIMQELRERKLGVNEVEEKAPFAVPTSPDTDPDKLALAIKMKLEKKGAKF